MATNSAGAIPINASNVLGTSGTYASSPSTSHTPLGTTTSLWTNLSTRQVATNSKYYTVNQGAMDQDSETT